VHFCLGDSNTSSSRTNRRGREGRRESSHLKAVEAHGSVSEIANNLEGLEFLPCLDTCRSVSAYMVME
jgi:hypothetical protein